MSVVISCIDLRPKSVIPVLPYRRWGLQPSSAGTSHPVWLHFLPCLCQADFRKAQVQSGVVFIKPQWCNRNQSLAKEYWLIQKLAH